MKIVAAMSSVLMSASLLFGATTAQADQLESVQQKGVLKVAVPQDFPPFGSVGTDLKPHGYDIDMAGYLAKKARCQTGTGASHQCEPNSLPANR
ncbi:hypothetical protein ACGRPS_17635 [Vibrio furnissii]|uniref:hypothetical protein n=1 Tax=Vibrio furnissii TaxID=29494 RepID=UPI0037489921